MTKDNTDLLAGQITTNSWNEAVFDGTSFRTLTISGVRQTGLIYIGSEQPNSLLCDGSAYPSSAYPDLFAKIGTTFGQNGAGTFRVPDFKNRVPRGVGSLINLGEIQQDALIEHDFSLSTNTLGGVNGLSYFSSASTTKPNIVQVSKSATRNQESIGITGSPVSTNNFNNATFTVGKNNTETRVKATGVNFWIYY